MTPTNEQIIAEANRRRKERGMDGLLLADFIIEVMREGWKPPEPVDPDVLAFREFAVRTGLGHLPSSAMAGKLDNGREARAFLAGARMAREQERERAKPLVKYVEIDTRSRGGFGEHARATLAEYRGEA